MKIKLNRETLEKQLVTAVSVIASNPQPPILREALFEFSEENLAITTSDGRLTMTIRLPYELEHGEVSDFVCDVQSLIKPVTLQKSEFMFLEVIDGKDIAFSTPRTRNKYNIPIIYDPESFPRIKAAGWSDPISINGKIFSKMIKKTSMIVNPNDLRTAISGINFKAQEGMFIMESTDMATGCYTKFKPEDVEAPDMDPVLIPRAISKVATNYDKSPNVKISIDEEKRNLKASDGSSEVCIRLIDSKFPPTKPLYDQFIPAISMKINRESLLLSLDRLISFGAFKHPHLVLDMQGEGLMLKAENLDVRKNAEELLEPSHKSDEMNFQSGVAFKQIKPAIVSSTGENLYLSQQHFKKPVFITDDSSEGFETLWLIAPVLLAVNRENQQS